MWNLYEIEKRFEQHIREIEKRSRRAHWYEKKERRGFRFLQIAGILSGLAFGSYRLFFGIKCFIVTHNE